MKVIGITGTSGSGKTTVCQKISEVLNAKILDADKIAKEMSYPGSDYLAETTSLFGEQILNEDKSLNRKALADIIYNDLTAKENLDKITFKFVCKKIDDEIASETTDGGGYVIIDAPLLLEGALDRSCDYVVAVVAEEETKIERICRRDNISRETAISRLHIQKGDDYYIEKSDYVIKNGREDNLEKQINEMIRGIISESRGF